MMEKYGSLIALVATALLALGCLVAVVVLTASGADVPSEISNVFLLAAGGVITAAGVATKTNNP